MQTFLAALIPAVLLVVLFYALDKNKEPVRALLRAFALGCFSIVITTLLQILIGLPDLEETGQFANAFVLAFYQAGFLEELAKLIVFAAGVYAMKEFDEWYDGVLYGATVGLGFAFVENLEYFGQYLPQMGAKILIGRSLLTMPMHALMGGVMGYYFGKAKFCGVRSKTRLYMLSALFVPVLIHGAFDFTILWYRVNLAWLSIPFVIYMWVAVIRLKKITQSVNPAEQSESQ